MKSPAFDLQGHRGSRGLMPENTIPAMIKGMQEGVTTLEMDVVITKDGKVVLSHEPFFNHEITTKPDGSPVTVAEERSLNIFRMTYEEVKTFDVGMKPHLRFPEQQKLSAVKPTLEQVIDSVEKNGKPFYNIETKTTAVTDNIFHPAPDVFVETLMSVIRSKKLEQRVIIQSFDFRTLRYLHEHYPQIKTAMLIEGFDKRSLQDQVKDLGFTPAIYSPEYSLVTASLVERCHNLKMRIIPWTVNDKSTFVRLKEMGVDGIITDYPNLLR
ncbi:MAG TPA: glycerophosphodiester phosphodiesterase [Chitinophagaceae bacterium]|nr:glycerophosphodiester phosphodiesterase [Chitinophagaceae bacterium]